MLRLHFKLVQKKKEEGVNIHLVSIEDTLKEGSFIKYRGIKYDFAQFLSEPSLHTVNRPKIESTLLNAVTFNGALEFKQQLELVCDIKEALRKYRVELTEIPYKLLVTTKMNNELIITNH